MRIRLSSPLTEAEISHATGIHVKAPGDREFEFITTNSQEVRCGDLFIGIDGENYSSSDFIKEAKGRGAITLSASHRSDYTAVDTRKFLLDLAAYYKKTHLPSLRHTIAITGSIGKTTTKNFTAAILAQAYKVHATEGNSNNNIGLPLTILSAPRNTELLVLECGTNHRGEIKELSDSASPDIAIITNIGTAHIGNFGSREAIAREKLDITAGGEACPLITPSGEPLLEAYPNKITVGVNEDADIRFSATCAENGYTVFCEHGSTHSALTFPYDGFHLLPSLMLAITAAYAVGMGDEEIQRGIYSISPSSLRYRIIKSGKYTVIDDAYNASFESVAAALAYLASLKGEYRSALIGDVLELGDYSREIHSAIGAEAARSGIDRLFIYGEYANYIYEGALLEGMPRERVIVLDYPEDTAAIGDRIDDLAMVGEIILIKGSNKTGLHLVADYIGRKVK